MRIYSWAITDAVTDERQFPTWINQPTREPSVHRYWRNALPPGDRPNPGNETYGVGSGFPAGLELPTLVFETSMESFPFVDCLYLNRGLWLLSDAAKTTVEGVDPGGFEFVRTNTRLHDGHEGPQYWIGDVVRFLDPVDEQRSNISATTHPSLISGEPMRSVSYSLGEDTVFKAAVIEGCHVFRPIFEPDVVFCDEVMASAISAARLSGMLPVFRGQTDG
ncbi:MAG: DUF1629 domain-containing protein [Alphaproteobacteria bacterium]|nr:DUF1629 domain-containing protein [Alphaproteobacteria bacterium]